MKYCIIGTINEVYQEKIGESFLDHYEDVVIATFNDDKAAKKYIEDSRLMQPQRRSFSSMKVFKSKSLLRDCESARVEIYEPDPPPYHNPIL